MTELLKWRLAGIVFFSNVINTLAIEHKAEDDSVCPRLDLTPPTNSGSLRFSQNICAIALTSVGSPAPVPVPWASMYLIWLGSTLAALLLVSNKCWLRPLWQRRFGQFLNQEQLDWWPVRWKSRPCPQHNSALEDRKCRKFYWQTLNDRFRSERNQKSLIYL